MRGTFVEVSACAVQVEFLPAEDEHDRPRLTISVFDEGLRQHVVVRIGEPTYALFADETARAEFERLLRVGAEQ